MSPALDTMPPGTKAALLRDVLALAHAYEKGALAARYNISLAELENIVDRNGADNRSAIAANVTRLEQLAVAQLHDHDDDSDQAPTGASTGKLTRVAVNRLTADPQNLRDDLPEIDELAETINQVGLLTPIIVRTDGQRLIVVDGHRRLAAVRKLRHDTVEAIIRPSMRTADVIAAMLITSGQRADLDPIEEARGLMRLKVERGNISDRDVAAIIGRTQVFVSGRLALLNLTPEQQEEVRAGNMKLVEATHHGRLNAGTVKAKGQSKNWHLGPRHSLSNRVKARCTQLGHPRGRTIGGMGCGDCWEHVIRADERVHLVQESVRKGSCDTCGGVTTPAAATGEA